MFRLLHISDIHIGGTYKDSESIACNIASDIEHHKPGSIQAIVVTGDIFEGKAAPTDFLIGEAVKFFEILLSEINSNQGGNKINKDDIIFVPGNHDLIRDECMEKQWSKYRRFLEQFYGSIPEYYNKENYSVLRVYHDYKIAFVGFNSCQIEKKKLFDDRYIDRFDKNVDEAVFERSGIQKSKVIELLQNEVKEEYSDFGYIPLTQITPLERKTRGLDNYVIIALFHHHFYLFPEIFEELGDSSLIRNHAEVLQHLKYMNVSIVLHGHKHFDLERPYITEDYYNSPDNIIDVFAGGSVGTKRKDKHTFSIMDVYDAKSDVKLIHNKFKYIKERLEPIETKRMPPLKGAETIVKLLVMLQNLNNDIYLKYDETALKSYKVYESCNKIIGWISEALTGFTEVYKLLDDDYRNILFLLYAVHYRVISYRAAVGKDESFFESSSGNWKNFYDTYLAGKDFCVSKEEYHELFEPENLNKVAALCDKILNKSENRKTSVFLAFTMLGIFFSDLFLVLTEYADNFKNSIAHKVNIKIEENKFHENVPAPRIVIKSDADRRSVYVQMLCSEATAHKMAVLFVKEFDIIINKFEDYFKIINLKLYYVLPKIEKDNQKNTLDNYNFEAYIPTLLPLLTGDKIYPSKVVFSRELIQNSIDAISVREAKDDTEFSKSILIEIKENENGKRYFKITDNGTGMDRYKIERYFTSIGRSFYSGNEYDDLKIDYKPISSFGIGFLSSFMVCREIDVKTKYYLDDNEGLKLHIPNYDGCFFIELEEKADVGTEIKLYLDCDLGNWDIIEYIKKNMLDIKYNITLDYLVSGNCEVKEEISAHDIREDIRDEDFKFFIPLMENGDVSAVDYEEIASNRYIDKYEYGILIRNGNNIREDDKCVILNAGILVGQAKVRNLFDGNRYPESLSFDSELQKFSVFYFNFPSNWLKIDVSRENVTGFTEIITKRYGKSLEKTIINCLYQELDDFEKYAKAEQKKIPLSYLQELIQTAIRFIIMDSFPDLHMKLIGKLYYLVITVTEREIIYNVERGGKLQNYRMIRYSNDLAIRKYKELQERFFTNKYKGRDARRVYRRLYRGAYQPDDIRFLDALKIIERLDDEVRPYRNREYTNQVQDAIKQLGFDVDTADREIFGFLTLILMKNQFERTFHNDEEMPIIPCIENTVLNYLTVCNADERIIVNYDDIEKSIVDRLDNWPGSKN